MTPQEFDDRLYDILHGGGVPSDAVSDTANQMIALLEKVRFASEIGNGVVVAWDTCAGCGKHHLRCRCPSGPREPRYIAEWREEWLATKERKAVDEAKRQAEHERVLAEREARVHKATPANPDDPTPQACEFCSHEVRRVPGGQGPTWVHVDTQVVAGVTGDEEADVRCRHGRAECEACWPAEEEQDRDEVDNGLDAALAAVRSEKEPETEENNERDDAEDQSDERRPDYDPGF